MITIHSRNPELYLVAGAGLHSHLTAAGGLPLASLAQDEVYCIVQLLTVNEEEGNVIIPAVHPGLQTVGQSPCSRHWHSEDP